MKFSFENRDSVFWKHKTFFENLIICLQHEQFLSEPAPVLRGK
jgi:hypothetical protein